MPVRETLEFRSTGLDRIERDIEASSQQSARIIEERLGGAGGRAARKLVAGLKATMDREVANAKVGEIMGDIDGRAFRRLSNEAKRAFNSGILQRMQQLKREGKEADDEYASLANSLKRVASESRSVRTAAADGHSGLTKFWDAVRGGVGIGAGVGVFQVIEGGIRRVIGAVGEAARAVAGFLADSVGKFMEAEGPWARLESRLHRVGIEASSVRGELERSAVDFQRATGQFDDEAYAESVGRLVVRTRDLTRAQQLTATAADIASEMFKDEEDRSAALAQGTTVLIRALNGSTTAFERRGYTIDKTKNIVQQIQQLMGGAAARDAQTWRSKIAGARAEVDNLQESIGAAIVESEGGTQALNSLVRVLRDLADWAERNKEGLGRVASALGDAALQAIRLAEELQRVMTKVSRPIVITVRWVEQNVPGGASLVRAVGNAPWRYGTGLGLFGGNLLNRLRPIWGALAGERQPDGASTAPAAPSAAAPRRAAPGSLTGQDAEAALREAEGAFDEAMTDFEGTAKLTAKTAEEFRGMMDRHRRELSDLGARTLSDAGANSNLVNRFRAKTLPDLPSGKSGEAAARQADDAADRTAQWRLQARLLAEVYTGPLTTAPKEIQQRLSEVARVQREIAQAADDVVKAPEGAKDEARARVAGLRSQLAEAETMLRALGPLEAEFAQRQADTAAHRAGMTEEQAAQAGRDAAAKFDQGLLDWIAAHPVDLAERAREMRQADPSLSPQAAEEAARQWAVAMQRGLLSQLKGGLTAENVVASLLSEFQDALNRETERITLLRSLHLIDDREAERQGEQAAVQFARGLNARVAMLVGAGKFLGVDLLSAEVVNAFSRGMPSQAASILAKIGEMRLPFMTEDVQHAYAGLQASVDAVAAAEARLQAVRASGLEGSREEAAAAAAVEAAQQKLRQRTQELTAAISSLNATPEMKELLRLILELVSGHTGDGGLAADKFVDGFKSIEGKAQVVRSIASAMLDIAGSGASQEMQDMLRGVIGVADAIPAFLAARRSIAAGGATFGNVVGMIGTTGAVLGAVGGLVSAFTSAAERHRQEMVHQAVALAQNTRALEEFRRGAISNVSQSERAVLLQQGTDFMEAVEKWAASPITKDRDTVDVDPRWAAFLARLQEITNGSFFDDSTGKLDIKGFTAAWKAFQEGKLASFGGDAEGRISAFEFLMQAAGDSLQDFGEKFRLFIEQLGQASDLKGTSFASELEKRVKAEGPEAAAAWLRGLMAAFAAPGGAVDPKLAGLFGQGLTSDEIKRILEAALGVVVEGSAGGASRSVEAAHTITEVQANEFVAWLEDAATTLRKLYDFFTGEDYAKFLAPPAAAPAPDTAAAQWAGFAESSAKLEATLAAITRVPSIPDEVVRVLASGGDRRLRIDGDVDISSSGHFSEAEIDEIAQRLYVRVKDRMRRGF